MKKAPVRRLCPALLPGTYDDAVDEAAKADGLVIADTSTDPDDPVVRDVMDGYQLISREVIAQLRENLFFDSSNRQDVAS